MTPADSPQGQVPTLRRNGKRPSCEPCRKSKLSCDHVTPVCGRCQRRKAPEKCTYHPAPMTGLAATKPSSNLADAGSKTTEQRSTPLKRKGNSLSKPIEWIPEERVRSIAGPAHPGFLGSTSYSAVFAEHQDEIDLEPEQEVNFDEGPTTLSAELQRKVSEGAAVLAVLSDLPYLEPIASKWMGHSIDLSLMAPIMPACLESVRADLYEPHIKHGTERGLLNASSLLFQNLKPLKSPPYCTFDQYTALVTGENIRWEIVGMVFTACGLSCMHLTNDDSLLDFVGHRPDDRRLLVRRMLDASNACVAFLDEAGVLNDPVMWLTQENCMLVSQILGDASYLTWRRLGDLSTAIFALGLHQEIKTSPEVPFWLAEYRRRCLALVYGIDKLICTFVGRPPRISRRYCTIDPPLDLDFDDLNKTGEELRLALAQLGPDGWNTTAPATMKSHHIRAFCFTSQIREEILELSLGPHQENTFDLAADIARRNKATWEAFPERLRYNPDVWGKDLPMDDCVLMAICYLDVVYNDFMLQRTLVRRLRARSDEVIRISRLLMTTLIDVLSNNGRFTTMTGDGPWMVVLYGLPAAGVLALELLQQTQSRARLTSSFPRSEIIQNLSVFISYLGWVHTEGDGNYHLCMQARRMIQRVLDKVLSPTNNTAEVVNAASLMSLPTPTNSDFDGAGDVGVGVGGGLFDFSWMENNAEFEADFWMNLPDHPLLAVDGGVV